MDIDTKLDLLAQVVKLWRGGHGHGVYEISAQLGITTDIAGQLILVASKLERVQ